MVEVDRLAEYVTRRDFSRTGEPGRGTRRKSRKDKLSFVVQKHDASRLHYDFRLEWDGTLLSWAVTRGPSDDPREKRLAVRTEDHPLDYAGFEGTIPKDQYGGGTVMVWDRGTWEPVGDPEQGLSEGKLKFRLKGERMNGGWALVRMRGRKSERRENWLLIKERDGMAGDEADHLTGTFETSVKTGRLLDAIEQDGKPKRTGSKSGSSGGKMPKFRKPQLATLYDAVPEGESWIHETKFDGYRCIAAVGKGGPRFFTRSGQDWTDKYQALADAFDALEGESLLLDGEIMAADVPKNGSAFSALQAALHDGAPLLYYVFDILERNGRTLTDRPLLERKAALEEALAPLDLEEGKVRVSAWVEGNGGDILEKICKAGGEGIVSKKADAPYRHSRTKSWRKVKCGKRQEFVIGGYSPSSKRGRAFASLLLGQYADDGRLCYRGRAGTGFSANELDRLGGKLKSLSRKTAPFEDVPGAIARDAAWVTPKLVAEIEFAELTAEGHVRHGAYLGLRGDKEAEEVTPENETRSDVKVEGITITHPDRELFAKAGVSKLDIARHYGLVGERMVEICGERPISLLRCPAGIEGECFFQKHAGKGFPDELTRIDIAEKDGETGEYLYASGAEGYVAAAQMGTIEFHGWAARADRLERPDRMVFDLDPDEKLGFAETKQAAFDLKALLKDIGLEAYAMATGGKGIHVVVPLRRTVGWETLKSFAKTLAHLMAEREPDRFTATMTKDKRKGKIFIDWLRNERGATAILPYSVRARPGAPVATPVTWDELKELKSAAAFGLKDMAERLGQEEPALAVKPQTLAKAVIDKLERRLG
ncbi:DNA ligase D [Martelella lutilitoris]|uniref:DNA ligase (ATP) n=1 Tax=Martelella lutilitoris TaxID=2583532 RepID=A0A7T7KLU6_9HYPH|nr:DNA ligase D [Martelella lutilitoris]QQM31055.1 DNA ligase D [Martelella lutilitoris]